MKSGRKNEGYILDLLMHFKDACWLMENNFQGKEGQTMPTMPDDFVNSVTDRYIELYEKITGESFQKADNENVMQRIESNIQSALTALK